jgi:hypothetical protein
MCDKKSFQPVESGKIYEEDMFRIPIDSKHIDNFTIPPPLSPEELYKQRTQRTLWLTGDKCLVCNEDVYTDGKTLWCGKGCRMDAKRREEFEFLKDVVR